MPDFPIIYVRRVPPTPTIVFDSYWKFACERQNVFFRRIAGDSPPWTTDQILLGNRFTNVYRASDRVSQYLIRSVIAGDHRNADDTFFRIMLFKVFNRISTWILLEDELLDVTWSSYDYDKYDSLLTSAMNRGTRIFSGAYIMPSGGSSFGNSKKHRNYLRLIETMMHDGVPSMLSELPSLENVVTRLQRYPMIGGFLAYQYAIDLNYSLAIIDFDEMDYVKPGPGAIDGISKCFSSLGDYNESEIIRWTAERQESEFAHRGLLFKDLWGRSLTLIDCQNVYCEISKYARIAHPDVIGMSGRTKIKQRYQPGGLLEPQCYPVKWGLATVQKSGVQHEII